MILDNSINTAMNQIKKETTDEMESLMENSPIKDEEGKPDDGLKDIPFYGWECISLQLENGRDLNLVIKDE